MILETIKRRRLLAHRRFVVWVAGAVLVIFACGKKSDVEKNVSESAFIPRKSITVSTTGEPLLNDAQKDTLLAVARRSIAHYLRTGSPPPTPAVTDTALLKNRGCLIKLTVNSITRGTSGLILPVKPLAAAVAELSMRAATGGGRYDSLTVDELSNIVIQISVVSDPVTIEKESDVIVKRHGLVLLYRDQVAGILLPDDVIQSGSAGVAIDRCLAINRMTRKDWKPPEVALQAFTVQVFQERPSS